MQTLNRLSPKTSKRLGVILFVVSCLTLVAALTLPFVTLPLAGTARAGLITGIAVLGELAFAASVALLGKEYVNKIKAYVVVPVAPFRSFFLGAGVVVWAVATLLLRFVGQYLLVPGNTPLTIAAFVGVAIGMVLLMNILYRTRHVRESEKLLAATLFALPGMLFDAGTLFFFTDVFPNMPASAVRPEADSLFAAWLFCGYSFIILSGLITIRKPNRPA
ncbi:DUF5367 family protein [Spirosoma sordidisoli]|uniref:Transporter suffix domain-containing protein n=1 Tax=Spirosoma sordidisoli TaxID=2502893 RepID=A0A4Q2UIX7_9BACT|nr:DUF5367 family protein [Spirosoma sordidisoli]RYC69407.1 transporter suffix domain-containing protein [Spirosoma sordidisoli]